MSCLNTQIPSVSLFVGTRLDLDSLDDLSLVLEPNLLHIFLPKVFRLVSRCPAKMPALDFRGVFIKRAAIKIMRVRARRQGHGAGDSRQVLQSLFQLVFQELDIVHDVIIGPLSRGERLYKRENFLYQHRIQIGAWCEVEQILRVLDLSKALIVERVASTYAQSRHDDTGHLFLGGSPGDINEYRYQIESPKEQLG